MAGRPPDVAALVERLEASAGAKRKLLLFLETIAGKRRAVQASAELGITEVGFHVRRKQFFQEAVRLLEPRRLGRPPKAESPAEERIAMLEEELRELRRELRAREVREEIALTMPRVAARRGRGRRRAGKKTKRRSP